MSRALKAVYAVRSSVISDADGSGIGGEGEEGRVAYITGGRDGRPCRTLALASGSAPLSTLFWLPVS